MGDGLEYRFYRLTGELGNRLWCQDGEIPGDGLRQTEDRLWDRLRD